MAENRKGLMCDMATKGDILMEIRWYLDVPFEGFAGGDASAFDPLAALGVDESVMRAAGRGMAGFQPLGGTKGNSPLTGRSNWRKCRSTVRRGFFWRR